ncbi:MAG: metalloregulator ArsR/SmtB family transcription factor [Phascolarctobacterium sp.]|nr:metalloregulator ArsR/SmtB family transcription factor [Phascolarctobacterium sp.]
MPKLHSHLYNLSLPGEDMEKYIQPMADTFKILSDPTRIRILSLLARGELCVGCIASTLEMTHSAISHQLRLLRAANLVKFVKEGKEVVYSLDDDHVLLLFDQTLDHVKHKI